MTSAVTKPGDWSDEEKELRRKEVSASRVTAYVQSVALLIAFGATLAAGYAAVQSGHAVRDSAQYNAQQAIENQLTTAISAIGGSSSAEQVAGLILLQRDVELQVSDANDGSGLVTRQSADSAFATSLEVIGDYMHTDPQTDASFRGTVNPRIFRPGYGYLRSGAEPVAVIYAADQLRLLLTMAHQVARIDSHEAPSIDLSDIELYGVSWPGIDFRWLTVAWMPDIDLRSSNLTDSVWGAGTTLRHAYLQCADLSGADFRGVNLTNADLRGANVSGADFAGAILTGVKTTGAFGKARGLDVTDPASRWEQSSCPQNPAYWDSSPVP